MTTITLTLNEVLVLISEGMTMNNCKSLANKLRDADAPVVKAPEMSQAYHDVVKQLEITKQNLKSSNQQVYDYERALEKAKAQSKTWETSYHDTMAKLEKAKQTETKLRDDILKLSEACAHVNRENYEQTERANRLESKIRDLENEAKLDTESLACFHKWMYKLRIATGYDEGVKPDTVFSNSIELVGQHNELCKRAFDLESKLVKANDVIATVKGIYDNERSYDDVRKIVEGYYLGN